MLRYRSTERGSRVSCALRCIIVALHHHVHTGALVPVTPHNKRKLADSAADGSNGTAGDAASAMDVDTAGIHSFICVILQTLDSHTHHFVLYTYTCVNLPTHQYFLASLRHSRAFCPYCTKVSWSSIHCVRHRVAVRLTTIVALWLLHVAFMRCAIIVAWHRMFRPS